MTLLVLDGSDMGRYPADLADVLSSDIAPDGTRLDQDGRPAVSLAAFQPSRFAPTADLTSLTVRVPAGGGHSSRVSPADMLLANYLGQVFGGDAQEDPTAQGVPGWRVLELGTAFGAVGVFCGLLSPHLHVTIAETGPEAAGLARKNVDLNARRFHKASPVVERFNWEARWEASSLEKHVFQVVCASDMIDQEVDVAAAWHAVDLALDWAPGSQFILAHQHRSEGAEPDEWLDDFRRHGEGTAGFALVYSHLVAEAGCYVDAWSRRAAPP